MNLTITDLEERIVLEAAAAGDLSDTGADGDHADGTEQESGDDGDGPVSGEDAPSGQNPQDLGGLPENGNHILLIAADVDQAQVLADAALDHVKTVLYGMDDTAAEILNRVEVAADGAPIHHLAIASEGVGTGFELGADTVANVSDLDAPGLEAFWRDLGALVQQDGRIDLLACNVTASQDGADLVAALEQLTGRDVAASDDLTGNPAAGGDWVLETDGVDGSVYFDAQALTGFTGVLANSQPVLGTTSGKLTDINEGATDAAGDILAALLNGTLNASDTNNGLVNNHIVGAAVVGSDTDNGTWQYLRSESGHAADGTTTNADLLANSIVDIAVGPNGRFVYVLSDQATGDGGENDSLFVFSRDNDPTSDTFGDLTFKARLRDGEVGVDGLDTPRDMTFSPDGRNVYVLTGNRGGLQTEGDNGIAQFRWDANFTTLSYDEILRDDSSGGSPRGINNGIALDYDPVRNRVYYVSNGDQAFGAIAIDTTTGGFAATPGGIADGGYNAYGRRFVDGDIVGDLSDARDVVVSNDGAHIYVISEDRVLTFDSENSDNGANTLFFSYVGESAADADGSAGLYEAQEVVMTPNGGLLFTVGGSTLDNDGRIGIYSRDFTNPTAGTFGDLNFESSFAVANLAAADGGNDIAVSPDGTLLYVAVDNFTGGAAPGGTGAVMIYEIDYTNNTLINRVVHESTTLDGLQTAQHLGASPFGGQVYVAGTDAPFATIDRTQTWTDLDNNLSTTNATILPASTRIRFVPSDVDFFNDNIAAGSKDSISLRAWDGTANSIYATGQNLNAGGGTGPNGAFSSQVGVLRIDVNNVNDVPDDIQLSSNRVQENALGAYVGTLSTTDKDDPLDSFTYSIRNDPTNAFEIQGDQLRLRPGRDLDYEKSPTIQLRIRVNDGTAGSFRTENFRIDVIDVYEPGPDDVAPPRDGPAAPPPELGESAEDGGDLAGADIASPTSSGTSEDEGGGDGGGDAAAEEVATPDNGDTTLERLSDELAEARTSVSLDLLFDETQPAELRGAYTALIEAYNTVDAKDQSFLNIAFRVVNEASVSYKNADGILAELDSARYAPAPGSPLATAFAELQREVRTGQDEVRERSETMRAMVLTAAEGGANRFDLTLENAISAATERLNAASDKLLVDGMGLRAAGLFLQARGGDGATDADLQAFLAVVQEARQEARQTVDSSRQAWDQASEDAFSASVRWLTRTYQRMQQEGEAPSPASPDATGGPAAPARDG